MKNSKTFKPATPPRLRSRRPQLVLPCWPHGTVHCSPATTVTRIYTELTSASPSPSSKPPSLRPPKPARQAYPRIPAAAPHMICTLSSHCGTLTAPRHRSVFSENLTYRRPMRTQQYVCVLLLIDAKDSRARHALSCQHTHALSVATDVRSTKHYRCRARNEREKRGTEQPP